MENAQPDRLSVAGVWLEALHPRNREGLRAAAAKDLEIWEIYSYSLLGDGFDRWWADRCRPDSEWKMFTIHQGTGVMGMTGYAADARHPGVVEVGASYLVPGQRGSGLNWVVKWLLLSHLFAQGVHRVELRIDARNIRSRMAARKLGAIEEGVLRRHKVTHTGFIRDTHVFAITDADWVQLEPKLRPPEA